MEKARRRGSREWADIVSEQERSGLSAIGFCKERSIGPASFYQWRRRIRDAGAGPDAGVVAKGSFIDMGQVGESDVTASVGASPWIVTLDLGGGLKLTLQRGRD